MSIGGDCIHDIRAEWCLDCNPPADPVSNPQIWGEQAFEVIPVDDPIPLAEAADLAGLSEHQFSTGVAWLRETYPDLPLVSSRNGLQFTLDADQVLQFRAARIRSSLTTVRRVIRGAVLPYIRQVNPSAERQLARQANRLFEDIQELLDIPV